MTGKPLIVSYPNIVYSVDANPSDTLSGVGYVSTSSVNSSALPINVALNASDIASNVYERKLIVEDISGPAPQKVIEIDFYGEVVGEDERLKVMTNNLGRAFNQSDSIILRDHDPNEPLPDYLEINEKRKELMLAGEEIFPYMGSYKGLINAIKFISSLPACAIISSSVTISISTIARIRAIPTSIVPSTTSTTSSAI